MLLMRALNCLTAKATPIAPLIVSSSRLCIPWNVSNVSHCQLNTFGKMLRKTVPIMPKRPPNGYTLFFNEISKRILAFNPSTRAPDLAKNVAEQWNSLSAETKDKYLKQGKEMSAKYKVEKEKFMKSLTDEQKAKLKQSIELRKKSSARRELRRELKKTNFPTKSLSSYAIFIRDNFDARKGVPVKELFAEVTQKWKSLSEAEKAPYVELAKQSKEQYTQQLESWKQEMQKPENFASLNKLNELKSGIFKRGDAKTKPKKKKSKSKSKRTKKSKKKAKTSKPKTKKTKGEAKGKQSKENEENKQNKAEDKDKQSES